MQRRLLHHHAIVSRRGGPEGSAAPSDFVLSFTAGSDLAVLPSVALAYCLDMPCERVLFTVHDPADVARLFAAPFLFLAQLQMAIGVVSVPFERLAELAPAGPLPRHVYVFSPGRTGSTLLARLLQAAGLAAASEPDVLAQIALLPQEAWQRLPAGMDAALAACCVNALSRTLGGTAFIKLRSQCNKRPLALLQASPGCRVVFMLRGAAAWGLSRHRAFAEDAEILAVLMLEAFNALDAILRAGVRCDVIWFETLVADPAAMLSLCAPGCHIEAAKLAEIMAEDSQQGTVLARDALGTVAVHQDFITSFAQYWVKWRASAVWTARTEALVAEMVRT